ncbi:MAG: chromosomal replication initiator protein DnaA [Bacilli bacterium]|nr:chromosomal replication initiator protein DnaA [Bacilli bacterium]
MPVTVTELGHIWNKVLTNVKNQIPDTKIFDAFLSDSFLYSYENNTLVVGVNSNLALKILNDQYIDLISGAAREVIGQYVTVEFKFIDTLKQARGEPEKPKIEFFKNSVVNTSLTFDNFIVGKCNIEAQQAAIYIAANPGKSFNPLFIHSNSGLGKTHLLQAIVNYIQEKDPQKHALYITSNDFIEEFIQFATGETNSSKLKEYIYSFDALLIDDIQFIGGKKQTEQFLFEIFNTMLMHGKQVVITSDKHPSELKNFDERMKSRFGQGLTQSISNPDTETCVKILKSKINAGPLDINCIKPEVLEFIAEKFSKNIRNIDEALNKLVWYTTMYKPSKFIDMDTAFEALQSLIDVKVTKSQLNQQKIINVVADYYSLTPSQLTAKTRTGEVVVPRQISMYLMRYMLDLPFSQIGLVFGGKDHSTVMHAVNKVETELKIDVNLQTAISEIKKLLK